MDNADVCDSCGCARAIESVASSHGDVPFLLCSSCRNRLIKQRLTPAQWFSLAAVHGADAFLLRNESYSFDAFGRQELAARSHERLPTAAELNENCRLFRDQWVIALTGGESNIYEVCERTFPARYESGWGDVLRERVFGRSAMSVKVQCMYLLGWAVPLPPDCHRWLSVIDETGLWIAANGIARASDWAHAASTLLNAAREGMPITPCLLTTWRQTIAGVVAGDRRRLQEQFDSMR